MGRSENALGRRCGESNPRSMPEAEARSSRDGRPLDLVRVEVENVRLAAKSHKSMLKTSLVLYN